MPEKEANEEIILEFVTQLNLVSHEKLGAGGLLRSKLVLETCLVQNHHTHHHGLEKSAEPLQI